MSINIIFTGFIFVSLFNGNVPKGYLLENLLEKDTITTFICCWTLLVITIYFCCKACANAGFYDNTKTAEPSVLSKSYRIFHGNMKATVLLYLISIIGSFVIYLSKYRLPVLETIITVLPAINVNLLCITIPQLLLAIALLVIAIRYVKFEKSSN